MDGTPLAEANEDNTRHGIYLARMPGVGSTGDTSTKIILVKFTAKCNETAHCLLADHDPPPAPTLYHCMGVIGGLYMVVMKYMPNAKTLHRFFAPSPLSLPPDAEAVRRDLTKALDLLHGRDLVFGDLRLLNVLYSAGDKRGFFDGVGKDGEDRYSPCLNTELGLGVEKWQMTEKSRSQKLGTGGGTGFGVMFISSTDLIEKPTSQDPPVHNLIRQIISFLSVEEFCQAELSKTPSCRNIFSDPRKFCRIGQITVFGR